MKVHERHHGCLRRLVQAAGAVGSQGLNGKVATDEMLKMVPKLHGERKFKESCPFLLQLRIYGWLLTVAQRADVANWGDVAVAHEALETLSAFGSADGKK